MKTMHKNLLMLAGGLSLLGAAPAFAGHDDHRHWKRHHRMVEVRHVPARRVIVERHFHVARPVYLLPLPVYRVPVVYRVAPARCDTCTRPLARA